MAIIYAETRTARNILSTCTHRQALQYCEQAGWQYRDEHDFAWGLGIEDGQSIETIQEDLIGFNADVIVHQCNCQGVMGAGIARQVRDKLLSREQFQEYRQLCQKWHGALLSRVQWCPLPDGRRVANLFGQEYYGRDGRQYTDYGAVLRGFKEIVRQCEAHGLKDVAIPYRMGCSLGGGDWDTMYNKCILPAFMDTDVSLWVN